MTMLMQMQWMIQSGLSTFELLDLFPFRTVSYGESGSMCLEYDSISSARDNWMEDLDFESLYMKKIHLTLLESLILYFCFGVSLLSFMYASFLLLESLVHFGLVRCQRKLKAWKHFLSSKHRRL